jgi:hypothetical protein
MTPELASALLQSAGPLGLGLIFAGWAISKLYTHNAEVQEKRIADAQAATAKLLALQESQHKSEEALTRAMDATTDAVRDLRPFMDAQAAEIRALRQLVELLRADRTGLRRGG